MQHKATIVEYSVRQMESIPELIWLKKINSLHSKKFVNTLKQPMSVLVFIKYQRSNMKIVLCWSFNWQACMKNQYLKSCNTLYWYQQEIYNYLSYRVDKPLSVFIYITMMLRRTKLAVNGLCYNQYITFARLAYWSITLRILSP